jgi:hypothetical protein
MAKIKQGVLGGFSGSIANVTGSSWKGIAVMKSKPLSVANPNTDLQVAQRTSFKSIATLFSVLLALVIKPVYNPSASKMSGYNLACSINKQAFNAAGVFVPANCTIGNGSLPNVKSLSTTPAIEPDLFTVDFLSNVPALSPRLTDVMYGWAIEPISGYVWATNGDATRGEQTVEFSVVTEGVSWVGNRTVYCYLAAVSADGRQATARSGKQELVVALA